MGQAGRVADSRLRPLVFFPTSLALCRGSHRGPGWRPELRGVHNCAQYCPHLPHACAQMHTIACATAHKTAPPAPWLCTTMYVLTLSVADSRVRVPWSALNFSLADSLMHIHIQIQIASLCIGTF